MKLSAGNLAIEPARRSVAGPWEGPALARADWVAAALVGLLVCLAYGALASWMLQARVFDHFNRMFDADPGPRLGDIASGWSSGASIHWAVPHSVHPLLPYLFSPFARALSLLARLVGAEAEPLVIRQWIGVWVVPALSGLSAFALSLVMASMAVRGLRWVLGIVMVAVAFSSTVFGSLPDDKAITRWVAVCVLVWLWLVLHRSVERRSEQLGWWCLACLVPGITITNAYFFFTTRMVAWVATGRTLRWAVRQALGLTIAGTFVVLVVGVGMGLWHYGAPTRGEIGNYAGHWLAAPGPDRLASLVSAVGESLLPLQLVVHSVPGRSWSIIMLASGVAWSWSGVLLGLLVMALMAWGGLRLARLGPAARWLAVAALLQFGYAGLFAVWGDSPFLYSQHWLAGQQVLLIGLLVDTSSRDDRWAWRAAAGLALAMLARVLHAWPFILEWAPRPGP